MARLFSPSFSPPFFPAACGPGQSHFFSHFGFLPTSLVAVIFFPAASGKIQASWRVFGGRWIFPPRAEGGGWEKVVRRGRIRDVTFRELIWARVEHGQGKARVVGGGPRKSLPPSFDGKSDRYRGLACR